MTKINIPGCNIGHTPTELSPRGSLTSFEGWFELLLLLQKIKTRYVGS